MNYWIDRKKSSSQAKLSSRNQRLKCSGEKNNNIHDFKKLTTRSAEARLDSASKKRILGKLLLSSVAGVILLVLMGSWAAVSGAAAAAKLPQGYFDVTNHSGVDATGRRDSTAGLVAAIAEASKRGLAAFLPSGTYLVSDTVRGEQPRRKNNNCGKTSKSIVLVGSTGGENRPKIVLADNSKAFANANRPRPVVHILLSRPDGGERPPCAFGQVFRGIDIDLGSGNPGAVGIKMDAAQRSALEDVSIDATGAYAGVIAVPGRGMATVNVSVRGGRYGFDLRKGSLGGSLVGVQMREQTAAALRTAVFRGIAVAGFAIEKAQGPVIEHGGGNVQASNLLLTNGIIELGRPGVAISNQRNGFLHIRNVYVRGATDLVKTGNRQAIKAAGNGWTVVESYTSVPGVRSHKGTSYPSTNVIEGKRSKNELASVHPAKASPPNFVASHIPQHLASFEDKGVVSAADFGADGSDSNDDTAALQRAIDAHDRVFLPAGTYRINKALRLRKHTQLLGVPGLRTQLKVGGSWKDGSSNFMIVSPNDADASTVVSDVSIYVPGEGVLGAVHWRAGRNSMVRNIAPAVSTTMQMDKPRVIHLIEGNGGGRWYRWESIGATSGAAQDESNILLVQGTTEPLSFYGVNPEHAGAAMVTIENARNVRLFGAKTEGRRAPTLVIRNSRNILVSAWMGNPKSGDVEYVRLENNSDIELAGVARPGPSSDPMLIDVSKESRVTFGSNEYLTLYRRGMVDLGAWSLAIGDGSG